MKADVMFSRASDEWETPQDYFDVLDAEFQFDLDVAATFENAKCDLWLDKENDGLSAHWHDCGRSCWMNPPYSQVSEFMAKAHLEAACGCTVVCLVPARTDTRWWFKYIVNENGIGWRPGVEVRFVKGRLKFGSGKNSAPFPSVVVIFRPIQK